MKGLTPQQMVAIATRAVSNHLRGRPLVVSFEVTLSCMANCRHCDTGGLKPNEMRMQPTDYGVYLSRLKPAVVQLSGGEPLLREDLNHIVRSIRSLGTLPLLILVSNAQLLTEAKYLELKQAGVDRVSISLDFPDERHDDFRRMPGLYAHLDALIPQLASHGNHDIAMNCAITRANLPYILDIASQCQEWGVGISYSAYSALRTKDDQYLIRTEEELALLKQSIEQLIAIKRETGHVLNSTSVLRNICTYFREGGFPGCHAGRRFFVIRPEGVFNPCSMHRHERYDTQEGMTTGFSDSNECQGCYVAIRAYADKSLGMLLSDAREMLSQRRL